MFSACTWHLLERSWRSSVAAVTCSLVSEKFRCMFDNFLKDNAHLRVYPNVTTWHSGLCFRKSLCCLSVTFVRPIQRVETLFGNISSPFCILAILWPPCKKILRRSSQGNPSVGGVKQKRGSKIDRCHVRVSHLLMSFLFYVVCELEMWTLCYGLSSCFTFPTKVAFATPSLKQVQLHRNF